MKLASALSFGLTQGIVYKVLFSFPPHDTDRSLSDIRIEDELTEDSAINSISFFVIVSKSLNY